jgi:hypothetical protein
VEAAGTSRGEETGLRRKTLNAVTSPRAGKRIMGVSLITLAPSFEFLVDLPDAVWPFLEGPPAFFGARVHQHIGWHDWRIPYLWASRIADAYVGTTASPTSS